MFNIIDKNMFNAYNTLNGMDRDLLLIAKDDEFGRKLQDLGLLTRKRAPKRSGDY